MNVVYENNNDCFTLGPMSTFGQRVKEARGELSQEELARRVGNGLTQQAIAAMEDPKQNRQGSKHAPAIAAATGVEALWLARGTGPKRKNSSTNSSENGSLGGNKEEPVKAGLPKIVEGLCLAFTEDAVRAELQRYEERKERELHPIEKARA